VARRQFSKFFLERAEYQLLGDSLYDFMLCSSIEFKRCKQSQQLNKSATLCCS